MRRLSIKLEKNRTRSSWYQLTASDKEINFITKLNISGLILLLKGSGGFGNSLLAKRNISIREKLTEQCEYFGFEYDPIKEDIIIEVDIL